MGNINLSKYILQLSMWTFFIQAASKMVSCVKEASTMLFCPTFSPPTKHAGFLKKLTFAFALNGNVLKITFIAFSNGVSLSFNSFLFIFSSLSQWIIHLNHQH